MQSVNATSRRKNKKERITTKKNWRRIKIARLDGKYSSSSYLNEPIKCVLELMRVGVIK